ncbi:hypothetical protein AB6A40_009859 [Gnathostoma spinigerum]|uniref:F-box domain-containing protein n=1 Tax=Gnathostoma spinigerum TaxID=75299 RepID=A0ABD6ET51_9BILA
MHVTVKYNGRVERFEDLDQSTFHNLYDKIAERFNLDAFEVLLGSEKLPMLSNEKILDSSAGLVSGDRLTLAVHDSSNVSSRDSRSVEVKSNTVESETNGCTMDIGNESNGNSDNCSESSENVVPPSKIDEFIRVVRKCLKAEKLILSKCSKSDNRLKVKHACSPLYAELDFRFYIDSRSTDAHVTPTIVYQNHRRYLNPIIIDVDSDDVESAINSNIRRLILRSITGHENPLLRSLSNPIILKKILWNLTARDILNLEETSSAAKNFLHESRTSTVWQHLVACTFGKETVPNAGESYRNLYKRLYCKRKESRGLASRIIRIRRRVPDPLFRPPSVRPTHPFIDPDMPNGPLQGGDPWNPFYPFNTPDPENPGSGQPFNPFDDGFDDPFGAHEHMRSRPRHPGGLPRQIRDNFHNPRPGRL